jgi:carbon monoxide dehydrogenase subunit G
MFDKHREATTPNPIFELRQTYSNYSMHSITVVSHVNATPDKVWDAIGDPSKISSWHPVIAESPVNGSERHCTLANGAEIEEKIESVDNEGRTCTYIITKSPLPLASYRSTIKVDEEGDGSAVTWSANFEPAGAPAEEVAAMLIDVYQAGLAALRAM